MRVLHYWEYYPKTGQTIKRKFHPLQTYFTGCNPYKNGEYVGLPFIKAAALVEDWNKKLGHGGVTFLLHEPEKYKPF